MIGLSNCFIRRIVCSRGYRTYSSNYRRQRDFKVYSKLKTAIDADSGDDNGKNNAAPVPSSSERRNIMKSMRSYLDEHFNGEMNFKRTNDIEQFDAKKCEEKYQIIFQKLNMCFVFKKKLENFLLNFFKFL
ncbi:hypothetical protein TNCV_1651681 [Trichonephila clavipes]|nr:hypothetical protein TNCV_1651681 [Trichonephila clavipes]